MHRRRRHYGAGSRRSTRHRRRPGPQPRHRRRLDRPRRSGVRPARVPARPRRGGSSPVRRAGWRASRSRSRSSSGAVRDGLEAPTNPDRSAAGVRARLPASATSRCCSSRLRLLDRRRRSRRRSRWRGRSDRRSRRLAITGVGDVAYRATDVEAALIGIRRVGCGDCRRGRPRDRRHHVNGDIHADAAYRNGDGRCLHAAGDRSSARPDRLTIRQPGACDSSGSSPGRRPPDRSPGRS